MTTSTDTPTTQAAHQATPSAPDRPQMQAAGWLLFYTNDEVDFHAGNTKPQHLTADCDRIEAIVLASHAEHYAQETSARQRELCDAAWDAVETLQCVGACQAKHQSHKITALEAEVARLKRRERACATMDEAEKIALVRALQECAEVLGIGGTNPSPAALVEAVHAAAKRIAELEAERDELRAQAWPTTPDQVRTLLSGRCAAMRYALPMLDDITPPPAHEDDTYTLSAHDLITCNVLAADIRDARISDLEAERDELLNLVHIITSECDELADGMQSLRAKLDRRQTVRLKGGAA